MECIPNTTRTRFLTEIRRLETRPNEKNARFGAARFLEPVFFSAYKRTSPSTTIHFRHLLSSRSAVSYVLSFVSISSILRASIFIYESEMRSFILLAVLAIFVPQFGSGAQTTTSPTFTTFQSTTAQPQWIDPTNGGKSGNPGARIHLSNKTIDAIHTFASNAISNAIQLINLTDFSLSIGPGVLTIRPPKVTEAKFGNVENELVPPNKIDSQFSNGKIVAGGKWQFKPNVARIGPMSGGYKISIVNAELNATTQLVRNADAKPVAQLINCNSYLGEFHIELEGAGQLTTIDNCDDHVCNRIREHYEDAVCLIVKTFVQDVINQKLSTFPAKVIIHGEQHKVDYGLQNNEPKVADGWLQAGLEGKYLWRGSNYVPFSPNQLNFVDHKKMLAFELSDYTFNTMLHQAHAQGHQYSAAHLASQVASIQQQLKLNCTGAPAIVGRKGLRAKAKALYIGSSSSNCLGSIFDNVTNIGEFPPNATGDLVYKSNKAPSIYIQSAQYGFFDGGNGVLEVYGPATGQYQQKKLLGRADVRVLRGDFVPKFQSGNITGAIKITTMQLDNAQFGSVQSRSVSDEWLAKLAQFATPIVTEMINIFLNRLAQFPIPLLKGFECTTPDFSVTARTVQVDCDVRVV